MSNEQEINRNIRASIISSFLGIIGKALAIFKTVLIAATFGVSSHLDAFWVAVLIPNILPVFVRGAFVTAFVPFFLRLRPAHGEFALWQAANTMLSVLLLLSLAATAAILIWPQAMINAIAPGLSLSTVAFAMDLLRITAFALVPLVVMSMLTAVSVCRQRFVANSLEGITTNIVVIACVYGGAGSVGLHALAWGIVGGFVLQLFVMMFSCRDDIVNNIRLIFWPRDPLFREYLSGFGPVLLGSLTGIGMGIVTQLFVSYLDAGSISILQYASMIAMLPIEIFATSIQSTFFPTIAKRTSHDPKAVDPAHRAGVSVLLFVLVPITAITAALAEPIVRILLGYGRFSDSDIVQTALVLSCFAIGIVGRAIAYFNFQVLHALGRPWEQVWLGFLQLVMNASLSWALMNVYGVTGIALASSVSLTISMALSFLVLARAAGAVALSGLVGLFARYGVVGAVIYALLMGVMQLLEDDLARQSRWAYAGYLTVVIGFVLLPYLAAARQLGLSEAVTAMSKIERVFRRLLGVKNV